MVNGDTWNCTGTLVAPDKILTAAHCGICAASIEVGLIGMSGPNQAPGTAPPTTIHVPGASIHNNPAAYPDPPDCTYSSEFLKFSLNTRTVWGADVAVLDLPAPVSVQPKPVLLLPPYGFSAVQDLHGQTVTVIGRGKPDPDSTDLSVMRKGTSSVDAYRRLEPESCNDAPELVEPFAIQLHNDGGGESMIQGGDSGGPLVATVPGGSRVIGVNSASQGGDAKSFIAPTYLLPNSAFLSLHGVGATLIGDQDGDGVPDSRDNCPADANTDQIDLDADGVGDICDTCSPLDPEQNLADQISTYDGTPAAAYAALYNPGQDNANAEAEDEALLRAFPQFATADGGSVRPLPEDEYLRVFRGFFGLPCNGADATQATQRLRYRRGDVCDSIPAPKAEMVFAALAPGDLNGIPGGICDANGYGFATCSYEVPVGLRVTPIVGDGVGPMAGRAGVRFCECAADHATEADRRIHCGAGTVADCAIEGDRYLGSDPSWLPLSIAEADVTYGDEGAVPQAVLPWDFYSDLEQLSGVTLSFPLDVNSNGTIVGVPAVDGVLWTRAPALGGWPIGNWPDDGFRLPNDLASTYEVGDLRIKVTSTWHDFPEYEPAWPWEYCAVCGVFDFKWLWVLDDRLAIGVNELLQVIDLSETVDRTAMALLGGRGVRVLASESESMLRAAGVTRRELVVEAGGATPIGAISIAGGEVVGQTWGGGRALPTARTTRTVSRERGTTHRALAYSALEGKLFDLVWVEGARRAALSVWSQDEQRWSELGLTGPAVFEPLSATFRAADSALIVIDRDARGALRLVSINVDSGATTILSDMLVRDGQGLVASVAGDRRGGLLVAVSDGRRTRLAHLSIYRDRWIAGGRATVEGALVGQVFDLADGAHMVMRAGRAFAPRRVGAEAFAPGDESIAPLF